MPLEYYCQTCSKQIPGLAHTMKYCPHCGEDFTTVRPKEAVVEFDTDIRGVAKHQRRLIWCIAASIVISILMVGGMFNMNPAGAAGVGIGLSFMLYGLLSLVVTIIIMIETIRLTVALRWHIASIIVFALFFIVFGVTISCFSLLMLIVLNQFATSALRKAGLHVSFMGVRDEDVERLLDPYMCKGCGYSLVGNTSGRCPECGTPIAATSPASIAQPISGNHPPETPPPPPPGWE